ncbi:MAG: hypothetical protein RO009_05840 [Pseudorhodoplanes sp.]|jgi:hypothetical protein|nr:hypothetical protein [Pseudorhodoplanes sp.]
MSNERFLQIVFVILIIGFAFVLIDREKCENPDGNPCRFGGGGRGSVPLSFGK